MRLRLYETLLVLPAQSFEGSVIDYIVLEQIGTLKMNRGKPRRGQNLPLDVAQYYF